MSNLWITPEELGAYANTEYAYQAAKSASNILWALSGRKYSGITTVTERYACASRTYRYGPSSRNNVADIIDGEIHNIPSSDLDFFDDMTSDGVSPSTRLRLRGRPVQRIHTIRNRSGEVIDSSKYYLVDGSTIQAAPGVSWTPCDVEVTYTYGIEPPTMGKMAARTLARELAKGWAGDDDCMLPQRVTSISRQGVSYTLLDQQDFLDEMRTGIYEIDLFLRSVNPDRARAKARVFTPDVPRARRSTPKPFKYGISDYDVVVKAGETAGYSEVTFASLNAAWLDDGSPWVTETIIYNHSGIKSKNLGATAATINTATNKVKVQVSYADALGVLGMIDPGTFDVYVSRPDPLAPGETETIYLAAGNLRISTSSQFLTAYTIGQ
ncbi:head-to-tail adaptor [Actinomycetia phage DSL-LC01]|nr:head-to-tail adaptor [Actinomycetia phage DSL-LC01]